MKSENTINTNPGGLVVSRQMDPQEDDDDEVDWTGGFSHSVHNKENDEEEEDPFGDFASGPEAKWEEGFSTNFADMDVKTVEEKNELTSAKA